MRRFLVLLMAVLCIVSAAPVMAQNQSPSPGQGGGGGGEKKQKLASYLDQLRKQPNQKAQMEQIIRDNLAKEGATDIDKRIGAVSPILDQIIKMDDATWKSRRDEMVQAVWHQAHVKKSGQGQGQGQQGQQGQQGKQGQGKHKGGN